LQIIPKVLHERLVLEEQSEQATPDTSSQRSAPTPTIPMSDAAGGNAAKPSSSVKLVLLGEAAVGKVD